MPLLHFNATCDSTSRAELSSEASSGFLIVPSNVYGCFGSNYFNDFHLSYWLCLRSTELHESLCLIYKRMVDFM